MLYRSIHETPLYKFVDAFIDGNLNVLTISGSPSQDQLNEAWNNILTEYSEAIGSNEHKLYLQLLKQVGAIKITLFQIDTLIEQLRKTYTKPFADMLNKLLRTSFEFDPAKDNYDKLLDRCKNRSKGFLLDLHIKEGQLKSLESKLGGNNKKPDRIYFENALITLSDHAGFHLTDKIMTSEFCTRLNRYMKFIDSQPKGK